MERRIGVWSASEARYASRDRGFRFGFERRLVLVAWFAQPRRKVDQSWSDDQSCRVDGAIRAPRCLGNFSVCEKYVSDAVASTVRVDDAPAANQDAHQFPATIDITA